MSWSAEFGTVRDAAQLRKVKPRVTRAPAQHLSPAEREAQDELIEAAREAAASLLESPAFSDASVSVFASGQANPGHEPFHGRARREQHEAKGQTWETERVIEPSSYERITLTLQQQPPEGARPEVVPAGE